MILLCYAPVLFIFAKVSVFSFSFPYQWTRPYKFPCWQSFQQFVAPKLEWMVQSSLSFSFLRFLISPNFLGRRMVPTGLWRIFGVGWVGMELKGIFSPVTISVIWFCKKG
jgi:hypothetical protein